MKVGTKLIKSIVLFFHDPWGVNSCRIEQDHSREEDNKGPSWANPNIRFFKKESQLLNLERVTGRLEACWTGEELMYLHQRIVVHEAATSWEGWKSGLSGGTDARLLLRKLKCAYPFYPFNISGSCGIIMNLPLELDSMTAVNLASNFIQWPLAVLQAKTPPL